MFEAGAAVSFEEPRTARIHALGTSGMLDAIRI
jgi:GDP-D-mannose dehydratase